jgi:large subunit ribosomal protein L27
MSTFKLDLQFFAKGGKGGGSCPSNSSHRSYNPKNLGVKKFGGEWAKAGNIIVRQHGTKWGSGENTYLSHNYSIHAKINGIVEYFE